MSEFEERARRAADALREEGARISDTDAALADVLSGRSTLELVPDDGWSRRRTYAVTALTLGAAASLIGLAVVTLGDDQALVGDAPLPPDGPSALPSDPTRPSSSSPGPVPALTTTTSPRTASPDTETMLTPLGSVATGSPDSSTPTDPTSPPAVSAQTSPPVLTTTTVDPTTAPTKTSSTSTEITSPPSQPPEIAWTPTQPPPPEPPAADDLPYLEIGVVGGDYYEADYRIEPAWDPDSGDAYVQAFSNGDGSKSMFVRTWSPRPEVIVEPIPGKIGPWDLYDGSGEHTALTLATDDVAVTIGSNWLDLEQLKALAGQLGPRNDGGAGWDVGALPGDVGLVGEGYAWEGDDRGYVVVNTEQRTPLAQVDVTFGVESNGAFPLAPFELAPGAHIVDFDGRRALYEPGDGSGALTWEYSPGVYVTYRRARIPPANEITADDVRASVRAGVVETSRSAWEQTEPLPDDGRCLTFDC